MVGDTIAVAGIQNFARLGFLFNEPWLTDIGDQNPEGLLSHIQVFEKKMMGIPAIIAMYEGTGAIRCGYAVPRSRSLARTSI